jgi:hypothetical protein
MVMLKKMRNQRRPKHTATATMLGISKNDHAKRWRDEVEEDLYGNKKMARDHRERRKAVVEARSTMNCSA